MADIRPFLNVKLHVTVWLTGKCKKCNKHFQKKIYDYGEMIYKELENQLDETKHYIKNITCKHCKTENIPEFIIYKDEIRNLTITEASINYGNQIDYEKGQELEKAHEQRYEFFKEHEEKFWQLYTDTALANWKEFVNELNDFEIRDAFIKAEIRTQASTLNQLRKEVSNNIKTIEEKQKFWRYANEYFVYTHLLEIGALGWLVEKDIKEYGQNRMRFIILHFPLHESYEGFRTEWIGKIIKKNKGDNDFLFRRISMITDELNRTRKKLTKYTHVIEELKIEKSELENKLSKSYSDIREIQEQTKKMHIERDPNDIRKIHELKSFVSELINELKEKEKLIQELQPVQETRENVASLADDEEITDETKENDLSLLENKTVFIIGGNRQEQAKKEYPCEILTHSGETFDPEFYQYLNNADVIVILTQFVSHIAMWEAKSFAIDNDIPIYYIKGLNIPKILDEIAEKYSKDI